MGCCTSKRRFQRRGCTEKTLNPNPSNAPNVQNANSNASTVQNTGYMQSTRPKPDEISVVQSLPAMKLRESYVIEGDILTNKQVPEAIIKKFVDKTGLTMMRRIQLSRRSQMSLDAGLVLVQSIISSM